MHGAAPNRRTFFTITIACVAALAMPGFAAAQPPGEWDGLVLRPSSAVDLLYVRPEASLAGYKRVRLELLQVSFHQDWNPQEQSCQCFRHGCHGGTHTRRLLRRLTRGQQVAA